MARKLSTEKPKKVRNSNIDPSNKPLIAAGIGIAVVFLMFLIGMGVLVMSFLGRFAEDDTSTGQVTTITYSIKQQRLPERLCRPHARRQCRERL